MMQGWHNVITFRRCIRMSNAHLYRPKTVTTATHDHVLQEIFGETIAIV